MEINGIYFAKGEFYQIIRDIGGVWKDSKERPIVCLLKIDDTDIYWAIPMGNPIGQFQWVIQIIEMKKLKKG